MATQILNFGLTAQIDVRTVGYDRVKNRQIAEELRRRITAVPASSTRIFSRRCPHPISTFRSIGAALQFGVTASDIGNNLGTSLSSSQQVSPNFWTDPATGISLLHRSATPEYQVSSLTDLGNTPISTATAPPPVTQPIPAS